MRLDGKYAAVTESGCWLWLLGVDKDGYGKSKYGGKDIRAHRLSWILHNGDIPDGLHVCHRCDVPACINPAHLFLGTNIDNDRDKRRKGRAPKMAIHRETRLSAEQVLEIRALRGKERVIDLGARFGLHHSQISRIQRGLYHKHIRGDDHLFA